MGDQNTELATSNEMVGGSRKTKKKHLGKKKHSFKKKKKHSKTKKKHKKKYKGGAAAEEDNRKSTRRSCRRLKPVKKTDPSELAEDQLKKEIAAKAKRETVRAQREAREGRLQQIFNGKILNIAGERRLLKSFNQDQDVLTEEDVLTEADVDDFYKDLTEADVEAATARAQAAIKKTYKRVQKEAAAQAQAEIEGLKLRISEQDSVLHELRRRLNKQVEQNHNEQELYAILSNLNNDILSNK